MDITCPYCKGECSPYCKTLRKTRRTNIYELLYGRNLSSAIREAKGEEATFDYKKLKDVIKKGIALGYLYPQTYERWVYEYEQQK